MPNARRPAGPTKPTHLEREQADLREQLDEALGGAESANRTHAGKVSRENRPSPNPRNQDVNLRQDDANDNDDPAAQRDDDSAR